MAAPSRQESTHDVDGTSLRLLRSRGATAGGEPIVLVHGTGADAHSWDALALLLGERHEVLAHDRRGYGGSIHRPVRDYRVHVTDLLSILQDLGGAHVLGWSSGGDTAIAAAVERPDLVRTLTVLEAPFHGIRLPTPAVVRTMALAKWHQARGRHRVLAELDPHPSGVMVEHVRTSSLAALTMPVTWLLGEQTLTWYDALRRRAVRHVTHARTVRIPDAGHLALVENPQAVADAVLAATDRHPATGTTEEGSPR